MLLLSAILCLSMSGCREGDRFEGSRSSNDDAFRLEYTVFDGCDVACLELESGDSILVSVRREAGEVDIIVGIDGKEPIYVGKGLGSIDFSLNITEQGSYRITVNGHNACGSVSFFAHRLAICKQT